MMGRKEKFHLYAKITSGTLRITLTMTLLFITYQVSVFDYTRALHAAATLILQVPVLLFSEYALFQIEKLFN
jgi:putative effector of murein hydrolase LrgA (UPF0299 family)